MSGTAASWRAEGEIGGRPPARLDREALLRHSPHLRMPDYQSIGAWRDIGDRKSPRGIRDGIVRIVNGKGPAFHKRVKSTLHEESPPPLAQVDRSQHGLARFVAVSSVQVTSFVKEVHWKRRVEEDTRSELGRGFVGLDVVHDRVHVHD